MHHKKSSLSAIALTIRKVTQFNDDHYIRSLAVLIREEPDKRAILFDVDQTNKDFIIALSVRLPVFETFGNILIVPYHFRRPTLRPSEGYAYLIPRDPAGNMDLTLGLTKGKLTRMKKDMVWISYGEWRG